MTSLQQQSIEKFLAKLSESMDVDMEKIELLKKLLAERKKVKPDDLAKILSLPVGESIK
jgi:hypothetical protein